MSRYFNSEDDYLEHYGVKGMKWGVRKDSYYTPKGSGRTKKKTKFNAKGISNWDPSMDTEEGAARRKALKDIAYGKQYLSYQTRAKKFKEKADAEAKPSQDAYKKALDKAKKQLQKDDNWDKYYDTLERIEDEAWLHGTANNKNRARMESVLDQWGQKLIKDIDWETEEYWNEDDIEELVYSTIRGY